MLLIHKFFDVVLKIHVDQCVVIIGIDQLFMPFGVVKNRGMILVKYGAYLIEREPAKSPGYGCKQGTKSNMLRSGFLV